MVRRQDTKARVGADGAILNPVYLLTARVIRDLAARAGG